MNSTARNWTIALTTAVCVTSWTLAGAQDDLDRLLGDWTVQASRAASETAAAAAPALSPGSSEAGPSMNSAGTSFNPSSSWTAGTTEPRRTPVSVHSSGATQVASPIESQPPLRTNPFAMRSTIHHHDGQECDGGCDGACDGSCHHRGHRQCLFGRCEGGPGCGCEVLDPCEVAHFSLPECRPHHRPLLPPPSTFLQYFNSRNSYSSIWAGYNEETRHRLRNRSPYVIGHLGHGVSDCATAGCGAAGCQHGGCQQSGCDCK